MVCVSTKLKKIKSTWSHDSSNLKKKAKNINAPVPKESNEIKIEIRLQTLRLSMAQNYKPCYLNIPASSSMVRMLTVVLYEQAVEDFSNKYYSTIPHEFGRNRPPLINNIDILRQETSMLDTLTDMEVANTIMKTTVDKKKDADSINTLDKRFNELNLNEMTPLDHKSSEYKALAEYLIKSSGTAHGIKYRLEDIFRIERVGEADRFAKSKYAEIHKSDKRLLWHGSRTTNFGGILSQGLRIAPPEAPVSGYAFGKVHNCSTSCMRRTLALTNLPRVST